MRIDKLVLRFCALTAILTLAAQAAAASGDCGTVIAEANNDIASFNPVLASNLGDSRAAQLLFQPLVWVNRYGQVDAARSLASNIAISPDGMRYTLTLRPWHWSDGMPVTAADAVYDWQLIQSLGKNYPDYDSGGVPGQIKSVTAIDPAHLQILLKQPTNPLWFVDNGLSQFTPLPAHAWPGMSLPALYQNQSRPGFFTVVDGPMRIRRLDIGQDAIFLRNTAYAGPRLHLDRLVLVFDHSDGTALQQVESGTLDFAPVPMELLGSVHHRPNVHLALLSPVSFWYYINLNLANPHVAFFRDVRVRQAIADAIDQQAIIRLVYHGFGRAVYTPVPPVAANLLAPQLLTQGYPVGYDPGKARALLNAAGFLPGPGGIYRKAGQRLAFTALIDSDSSGSLEMVQMLQAQLRAAGIEMDLRLVAFGQMMQELQNEPQAWEAASLGTYLNPFPTGEGIFATGSGENNGGYSNPEMDRLITASITKPGLSGLYDYEIFAAAQQPVIFLPTDDHLDLVANRIHGLDGLSDGALLAPDALYCQ